MDRGSSFHQTRLRALKSRGKQVFAASSQIARPRWRIMRWVSPRRKLREQEGLSVMTDNIWADPRTWTAIGSLAVGFVGLLYGVLSGKWNRRESRLDALSKILQPLVKAAQELLLANNCRRRCEQLKLSFPRPEAA